MLQKVFLDGSLRGPRWILGTILKRTTDLIQKSNLNILLDVDSKCPYFLEFMLSLGSRSFDPNSATKQRFIKKNLLGNKNFSHMTNKILTEVVGKYGLTPIYEIRKHKKQTIDCSIQYGSSFNCKKYENFESKECHIFIADAFIETVAEINRLLTESIEQRKELVIVCRGASPDVINTLNVNRLRGAFRVYLVEIPMDLKTINSLSDIAVVSQSDVIDKNKGDLPSTKGLEHTVQVDKIRFHNGRLSIFNKKNVKNVFLHKTNLIEKLNQSHDFGSDILTDRIKQLGPYSCIVWLPDTLSESHLEELDNALRWVSGCAKYGYFEFEGKIYPANILKYYPDYLKTLELI